MSESGSPGWASSDPEISSQKLPSPQQDEESQPVLEKSSSFAVTSAAAGIAQVPPSPNRTCPHRIFRFLKFLTMATASLLLVAQIVSMTALPWDGVEFVLKLFVSSFCVLIVLNELEYWKLLKESKLFWMWVPKGYFYTFIGVVSVEENNLKSITEIQYNTAALFVETTSWMMTVLGMVYLLMGLFFCQLLHSKVQADYVARNEERKRMFESGLRSGSNREAGEGAKIT